MADLDGILDLEDANKKLDEENKKLGETICQLAGNLEDAIMMIEKLMLKVNYEKSKSLDYDELEVAHNKMKAKVGVPGYVRMISLATNVVLVSYLFYKIM
jgi:hypothetical protein